MTAAKGGKKEKETPAKKTETENDVEVNEFEVKIEELENEKGALEAEKADLTDNLRRMAAEFDNFRKRTVREKDNIYKNATANLVEAFLPVIDDMERAMDSVHSNDAKAALQEGIKLVYRRFREILDSLDIEEIECLGEDFDPELHHAVLHVEDENYGDNEVIEVLQKGYVYKDKVIRHSMVKVAN